MLKYVIKGHVEMMHMDHTPSKQNQTNWSFDSSNHASVYSKTVISRCLPVIWLN